MVYKKHRETETRPSFIMCFLFSFSNIEQKLLVFSYKGVSYKLYCVCGFQNLSSRVALDTPLLGIMGKSSMIWLKPLSTCILHHGPPNFIQPYN